jgi:glycolate oxidase FAD binding subunit
MLSVTETIDEYLPATQAELGRWMAENARGAARPVYPVGGRTALHYGYPAEQPGLVLSTGKLTQVIDYPARDMTVTVEAGIRIDDLAALLAGEGQRLGVDIAQSHRATLGGAVATNTSGPRRYALGTLRDCVIGVSAVDASGKMFKAGGRVVKNVAGYDLCKMLVGSLGTLALITQVTLKLRPEPETSALLLVPFDDVTRIDPVLERLLLSDARPVALDILDPRAAATVTSDSGLQLARQQYVLCIGVEGTAREVAWQTETLKAELVPFARQEIVTVEGAAAGKLWFSLTEFQVSSEEPVTFKATVRPSQTVEFVRQAGEAGIAVQAHAGDGIVLGHLPDEVTTVSAAVAMIAPLRELARSGGGNLVILNCDSDWKPQLRVFGDVEPGWPLMKQLKTALDPRNLLNPHRMRGPL